MRIPELVAAQRAFYQSRVTLPADFRLAQLENFQRSMEAHEPELLEALAADLGKPVIEAYMSEVGFVLSEIRHARRYLRRWMKPRRGRVPPFAWPARGQVRPEPRGVTLIMGPWNYPVQLILAPLVAAIAAGNCAILKPSEHAPATSAVVAKLVRMAFPPEFVTAVEGDRTVAEDLLREKFDHIFFTGSSAVGRLVMAAAAPHLTPVTLELGGKSPCIVCADAPLEVTARRIIWGKCLNAGQTCVAPDYLLVDRRIREPLVAEMIKALRRFFGDDPRQSADYGRIIHKAHFDRLVALLRDGTILHGGEQDAGTRYLAPTLLGDVAPDSPVMEHEIFGPILPVLEFGELDEALRFIRARPDPLALYLFTASRDTLRRVEEVTQSGGVCFNDTLVHLLCKDLPFGGRGESGMGAYHGRTGFDCFSHHKTVVRRSLRFDSSFRYPPQKTSLTTVKRFFSSLMGG
jgi:aldehyde dehydrogenase (NAD+)